jgi:hypothetical protein
MAANILDLSKPAAALDLYFGNKKDTIKVAFMLIATPISQDNVGETSVISNITDTRVLMRVAQELMNAMRLKEAAPGGSA